MTLADIKSNGRCRIVGTAASKRELQSRLYALGLYPGVVVDVLRRAPLGDPLQLRVGHSLLSIRRREALLVEVEAT